MLLTVTSGRGWNGISGAHRGQLERLTLSDSGDKIDGKKSTCKG